MKEVKEVLVFMAKAIVIAIVVSLIAGLVFLGGVIFRKNTKNTVACVDKSPTNEMVNTPSGDITFVHTPQEEKICRFVDGYDSYGKAVPLGTPVTGPAFVKPDRDIDWGYPIYIGEEYTTKASDEIVWLLMGDNACVDAQSMFFSHWGPEPINPK